MKRYFVDTNVVYSEFSDYEDAIQHYTALQDASVEGIITRNIKDYKYSDIPVLLPTEYHTFTPIALKALTIVEMLLLCFGLC